MSDKVRVLNSAPMSDPKAEPDLSVLMKDQTFTIKTDGVAKVVGTGEAVIEQPVIEYTPYEGHPVPQATTTVKRKPSSVEPRAIAGETFAMSIVTAGGSTVRVTSSEDGKKLSQGVGTVDDV